MQNQLQRAINLAKKTGDRLIVFDSAKGDDAYVVLSLKDYENLVLGKSEVKGLTEDELLDKINRDIAIWKSEQDFSRSYDNKNVFLSREISEKDNEENEGNSDSYENFLIEQEEQHKAKKFNRGWTIPSARKQSAEEVIEEDRQYLEEVPF